MPDSKVYWKRLVDTNPARVVAVFNLMWQKSTTHRRTTFGDGKEVSGRTFGCIIGEGMLGHNYFVVDAQFCMTYASQFVG